MEDDVIDGDDLSNQKILGYLRDGYLVKMTNPKKREALLHYMEEQDIDPDDFRSEKSVIWAA